MNNDVDMRELPTNMRGSHLESHTLAARYQGPQVQNVLRCLLAAAHAGIPLHIEVTDDAVTVRRHENT